ncbi:hypothetical protein BGM09_00915 [Streptomyces sp. CBMA29]|nr:hypothetical protein [Streptomyces sp. CBMA29]
MPDTVPGWSALPSGSAVTSLLAFEEMRNFLVEHWGWEAEQSGPPFTRQPGQQIYTVHQNLVAEFNRRREERAEVAVQIFLEEIPSPTLFEITKRLGTSSIFIRAALAKRGIADPVTYVRRGVFLRWPDIPAEALDDEEQRKSLGVALWNAVIRDSRLRLRHIVAAVGWPEPVVRQLFYREAIFRYSGEPVPRTWRELPRPVYTAMFRVRYEETFLSARALAEESGSASMSAVLGYIHEAGGLADGERRYRFGSDPG